MIGAIIGDIVGSRFEFKTEKRTKDLALWAKGCHFTDDSLLTLAIAKTLVDASGDFSKLSSLAIKNLKQIARKYPDTHWGRKFAFWALQSRYDEPYNSLGNGSAMRISPIAWVADDIEQLSDMTRAVTEITHNHPQGLKGAQAISKAIFMARTGASKDEIRSAMSEYYPILNNRDFNMEYLLENYNYDEFGAWVTCEGSVPQAIVAFLESVDFTDAIKNAVAMGGDSDTIGAMTGSVAEAYYGVPDELVDKALSYLPQDLLDLYHSFNTIKKSRVIK